jgi:tRNA pseudouridine65 synthase
MGIEICFEDKYMIVVNKPNNVLIHHSFMARNMDEESTLIDLLQEQLNLKLYPVHRLDRKTSGVILLVKKREDVRVFQDLFKQNEIQKTYYALVRGFAPESGVIDSPVKGRDANVHKEAKTVYRKLQETALDIPVHPYSSSRYSLLELKPQTGRLHQLRIHMNKISHPIVGDPKYGDRFHNRMFENELNFSKMFLHASSIQFKHPFMKIELIIKADFPEDWMVLAEKFAWNLVD